MAKGFAPNQGIHYADGIGWLGVNVQRALRSSTTSVADTATLIPSSPLSKRKNILIMNISTKVIYIGAADVTTSNGFPIYPRGVFRITIEDNVEVYGIVASGTAECRSLEGA